MSQVNDIILINFSEEKEKIYIQMLLKYELTA